MVTVARLNTLFFNVVGYVISLLIASGLFMVCWNGGVVDAIDGTHEIEYLHALHINVLFVVVIFCYGPKPDGSKGTQSDERQLSQKDD